MIYLLRKTALGLFWVAVGCVALAALFLVSTLVVLIVLGMFADAVLESTVAALKSPESSRKAFSRQFAAVSTRYSNLGQKSWRKAR
jgi:hypothetical protein